MTSGECKQKMKQSKHSTALLGFLQICACFALAAFPALAQQDYRATHEIATFMGSR